MRKVNGILIGKKPFKVPFFLSITTLFSVLNTSLICMVMVPFFKENGMLPMQLSIILLAKKIVKLFSDSFFGILFDKYGAKYVFLIGRLIKLGSYFVLYLAAPKLIFFVIAMVLDGLSYSAIHGKVSVFIYNNLSINNKINLYNRVVSAYYLLSNLLIALMSFSAGVLLKQYGYNLLIQISIITNILSLSLLFFIKNYSHNNTREQTDNTNNKKCKKQPSIKTIINNVKIMLKEQPIFLYLVVFYSIVNFMSWQFGSMASLILLDMGLSPTKLATAGAGLKIFMSIGCCLPIFLLHNGIKINKCLNIFTIIILLGVLTSLIYSPVIMICFMYVMVLLYATLQTSVEKTMDKISNIEIRATAISMATTLCTMITIISISLTGLIAEYFSYKLSFFITMSLLLCVLIVIKRKIHNKPSNLEDFLFLTII